MSPVSLSLCHNEEDHDSMSYRALCAICVCLMPYPTSHRTSLIMFIKLGEGRKCPWLSRPFCVYPIRPYSQPPPPPIHGGEIWINLEREEGQRYLRSALAVRHERCVCAPGSFVSGHLSGRLIEERRGPSSLTITGAETPGPPRMTDDP